MAAGRACRQLRTAAFRSFLPAGTAVGRCRSTPTSAARDYTLLPLPSSRSSTVLRHPLPWYIVSCLVSSVVQCPATCGALRHSSCAVRLAFSVFLLHPYRPCRPHPYHHHCLPHPRRWRHSRLVPGGWRRQQPCQAERPRSTGGFNRATTRPRRRRRATDGGERAGLHADGSI